MLAFVMIMSPMSISCMSVAAAPEASVMVAYSLTLWKMMAMGLVLAYVIFFDIYFFLCQGLCSDVSVGCEQSMEYCWNCSGEDACVWVDWVYEVLVVD